MRPTTSLKSTVTPGEDPMSKIGRAATSLAAMLVLVACTSASPAAPSSAPAVTAAPSIAVTASPVASVIAATPAPATSAPSTAASPAAGPTSFTSAIYGYSLTVPAGWKVIPASAAWDGSGAPFHDVAERICSSLLQAEGVAGSGGGHHCDSVAAGIGEISPPMCQCTNGNLTGGARPVGSG